MIFIITISIFAQIFQERNDIASFIVEYISTWSTFIGAAAALIIIYIAILTFRQQRDIYNQELKNEIYEWVRYLPTVSIHGSHKDAPRLGEYLELHEYGLGILQRASEQSDIMVRKASRIDQDLEKRVSKLQNSIFSLYMSMSKKAEIEELLSTHREFVLDVHDVLTHRVL